MVKRPDRDAFNEKVYIEKWHWLLDPYRPNELLLFDGDRSLAYISHRPRYCDRGHYMVNIEMAGLELDDADRFPRYYMKLETAKEETILFLKWRWFKIPAEVRVRFDLDPEFGGGRNG